MRSGDEPAHARSPLGLRLVLVVVALALLLAGDAFAAAVGSTAWFLAFTALIVLVIIDGAVVVHRIRQGPHFQPGPGVPPYRPVEPAPRPPRRQRSRVPAEVRRRRYLVLMAACLGLLLVAWVLVRPFSTTAAVVITLVAMVIPPIAAVIANAGWGGGDGET